MAPIKYIVSLQIFWKKNPFRTFLHVYIEKDFFLVLEIKGVFFLKPHNTLTRNDLYSFQNQKQSISIYTSV